MKRTLITLSLFLTLSGTIYAQVPNPSPAVTYTAKSYNLKPDSFESLTKSADSTGNTFVSKSGESYPVYRSKAGKFFIVRKSKTGSFYKQYLQTN